MCDQCDALKQENERLENSADELLTERDHAEEAVGDLFFAVMGYLAEWSNVFGYGDAREVVEEHDNELRKKVADLEAKVLELQSCQMAWQPIETAPKNTTILLLNDNRHRADDRLGHIKDIGYWTDELTTRRYWRTMGEMRSLVWETFTHWCPLPAMQSQPLPCTSCDGRGSTEDALDNDRRVECPDCGGSGRRDQQITPQPLGWEQS